MWFNMDRSFVTSFLFVIVCAGFSMCDSGTNPTKARVELGNWRSMGKFDLFYNGHWGAVCARRWGRREATVACRMLGFNTSTIRPSPAYVYQHRSRLERSVHVIDSCQGTELSLDECGPVGRKYLCGMAPGHFLVGIDCQPGIQNLTIQLDFQGKENSGLVEVHQPDASLVTNICGDTWGAREARVTCRELGFDGELAIPLEIKESLLQNRQDLPVELSDVECEGTERGLEQCVYTPLGYGLCEETLGKAGVVCSAGDVDFRISPLGSADSHAGWVEVSLLGRWWDVVHPTWTGVEATVFCRWLGYKWGSGAKAWYGRKDRRKGSWSFEGGCNGHEASLLECNISKWRLDYHQIGGDIPTSVRCFNDSTGPSPPVIHGLANIIQNNETRTVTCDVNGGDHDVTAMLQCPGPNNATEGAMRVSSGRHVTLSTSVMGGQAVASGRSCTCGAVGERDWYAKTEVTPNFALGPTNARIADLEIEPQPGSSFVLQCVVEMTNPPAEITWFNGSQRLDGAGRTYSRAEDDGRFYRTYNRWYILADESMTGDIITCLAKNPLTNQTDIDTKLLIIGPQLPQEAHMGIMSSKLASPHSLFSMFKNYLGSSYDRKRFSQK